MTKTTPTNKGRASQKRDETSVSLTFRVPKWLRDKIEKDGETEGRSLSNKVRHLLASHYN